MLRTPPWTLLPLTIRWLAPQFIRDFPVCFQVEKNFCKANFEKMNLFAWLFQRSQTRFNRLFSYFQAVKLPPSHMLIRHGHIRLKKRKKTTEIATQTLNGSQTPIKCTICNEYVSSDIAKCSNSECSLNCHLICLAKKFLAPGEYVPTTGSCPKCRTIMLWGDIVRKVRGISDAVSLVDDDDPS